MTALACNAAVPPQIAIARAIRNPLPRAGRQSAGNRRTIPDGRTAADARPSAGPTAGAGTTRPAGERNILWRRFRKTTIACSAGTDYAGLRGRATGRSGRMDVLAWNFLGSCRAVGDGATMTDPTDGGDAYIGATMGNGQAPMCISDGDRRSACAYLRGALAVRAIGRVRSARHRPGRGGRDRTRAMMPIGPTGGSRQPTMGRGRERRPAQLVNGPMMATLIVRRCAFAARRSPSHASISDHQGHDRRPARRRIAWPGVDERSEHRRGNWITGRGCGSAEQVAGRSLHSSSRSSLS
jgi:hypothetical protein